MTPAQHDRVPSPPSCPVRWDGLARDVAHLLRALPDGGRVELLLPGAVVGLVPSGDAVLLALLSSAELAPPAGWSRDGRGWTRTCRAAPGAPRSATVDLAVSSAVVVLRDVLGAQPDGVELWRPWSPPPEPSPAYGGADVQGRLW